MSESHTARPYDAGPNDVAVVGIACRLPDAADGAAFWRLLTTGGDAVGDPPEGRGLTGPGGYLRSVDGFDAPFFRVSPREAAAMDPQQRLALELGWELFEDAAIRVDALGDDRVGVYLGGMNADYAALAAAAAPGPYTLTGTSLALIPNRLSHALRLRGPSLLVESGQSSSLTAVRLACASLRDGDCELAVAGGVSLILDQRGTEAARQFGALSPDHRCHTFDARANGYVRGEGGGLVLLKPAARAHADGDRVYALISGSAVSNDGGDAALTVPSVTGQAAAIAAAYRDARVEVGAVDFVELHGTGTAVGDPVEAAALGRVFAGRATALPVGSVKTNIGHLEGAAGIAGLLKTILAVHHRELPPSLHFRDANPAARLGENGLEVVTALRALPSGPVVAGVSSFGMGGTNCHLVVRSAAPEPAAPPAETGGDGPVCWVVSAGSEDALVAQAAAVAEAGAGRDAVGVATTLATGRTPLAHRLAVVGSTPAELAGQLARWSGGQPAPGVLDGIARAGATAFVFTGQGAQRTGMGLRLGAAHPAFAAAFAEVAAALEPTLGADVTEIVAGETDPERLHQTVYTQAALLAFEIAAYRLLERFGVRADVLAGHSIGEIAAAHVAGVMSLPDVARLVAVRGLAMQAVEPRGGMLAVEAAEDDVRELLTSPLVGLAAVNGPRALVLSGPAEELDALRTTLTGRGVRCKALTVSHAFHSPLMEPAVARFRAAAQTIDHRPADRPIVSGLDGAERREFDADYWVRHLLGTVRFADGVAGLRRLGAVRFVEIGPRGTLVGAIRDSVGDPSVAVVPLLAPGRDEDSAFLRALGALHVDGVGVDWSPLYPGPARVPMPTYRFRRTPHWLDGARPAAAPAAAPAVAPAASDADAAADAAAPAPRSRGAERIRSAAAADAARLATDTVRAVIAEVLGHAGPDAVEASAAFRDLGLSSLAASETCALLSRGLGIPVPPSTVFDHPTPARLGAHLAAALRAESAAATETAATTAAATTAAATTAAAGADEPIAVVGIGLRLPGGVTTPEEFWELLADGRDVIGPMPAGRGWDLRTRFDPDPDASGKAYVTDGGFLDLAEEFDAGFFGISAREATAMDPQQRLLLEVAWEALERAGIPADQVRGTRTGVFVGAMPQEYGARFETPGEGEGYRLTGTTTSVASGRIAYTLGLEGPALTVDTACSASLVSTHLAVRSLRSGECTLALAGGVTVMSTPGMFVELTRQRALSPTGRCRAFAEDADGTGWAEGAALVVLERLSDAVANGHPVLSVIRGSAINQDGASNGLTAPSGVAQQGVIRAALADAGLSAADVDAVEAHGTGTRLGDPVEASALLATYGAAHSPERPLYLGSLKSNVGHTQSAAGVAGLIKMTLALRHERLPRTLHASTPSSRIDWSPGTVALLSDERPWPAGARPRRAGVSSFGISGTNAHLILESAPAPTGPAEADRPATGPALLGDADGVPTPVVLSARSADALAAQAANLRDWMRAHPAAALGDVAATLLTRRCAHPERAAVLAADRGELLDGLAALAAGAPHDRLVRARGGERRVAFVFPGQGSQWPAMAVDLYRQYPLFRAHVDACDAELSRHVDWSLRDVLLARNGAASLDRIDVVQPALFAVATGLAALWEAHGVWPAAVVGHSQGEVSAAYVAGALDLADAIRVIAERSRSWAQLSGLGAMTAVALPSDALEERLRPWEARLGVAAANSAESATVSGEVAALGEFEASLTADGIWFRRIRGVDTAGHSPQVDPLRPALAAALDGVAPRDARIPFYSTVEGAVVDGRTLDAEYWCRNMREPVRFHRASQALLADGFTAFVEIAPHPMLAASLQDTVEAAGADAVLLATLRRGDGGAGAVRRAVATAWTCGLPIDVAALHEEPGALLPLPTYPFRRTRFWPSTRPGSDGPPAGATALEHPVLTASVRLPGEAGVLLSGRLSAGSVPGLRDYALGAEAAVPSGLWLELAVVAGDVAGAPRVERLDLDGTLPLGERDTYAVQVLAGPADPSGSRAVTVACAPEASGDGDGPLWTTIARGTLGPALGTVPGAVRPPDDAPWRDGDAVHAVAAGDLALGPAFRPVRRHARTGGQVWLDLVLPEPPERGLLVHPALLDVPVLAAGEPVVVDRWEGVEIHRTGAAAATVRLGTGPGGATLDGYDAAGEPLFGAAAIGTRPASGARMPTGGGASDGLWRVAWETTAPAPDPEARVALLRSTDVLPDVPVCADPAAPAEPAVLVVPVRPASTGADLPDRCSEVLDLLRSAAERPGLTVCVLTTDAIAVDEGPVDVAARAVHGLVRAAQRELPGRFALIDVGSGTDAPDPGTLADVVRSRLPEAAVRGRRVLRPVLRRADEPEPSGPAFRAGGTVLVTGGTGTLGRLIAAHLVRAHGVTDLLLISRSGPAAAGADELTATLTGLGARVRIEACDAADAADLGALLSSVDPGHPLTGVVHTAGALDDGVLSGQDRARLDAVLAPKAHAALTLHTLTRDADLTRFVLFSSMVGTFGNAGQTTYAAANAALDALAELRRAEGLPATSIAWGLWRERSGLSAHLGDQHLARLAAQGLAPLDTADGLALFDRALAGDAPAVVATPIRTAAIRVRHDDPALPPLLRELAGPVRPAAAPAAPVTDGGLAARLAALPAAERPRLLVDLIRTHAAAVVTGLAPDAIRPAQAFKELGFDSLTAVQLRNRLVEAVGQPLPTTVVFDHPNPQRMAEMLLGLLVPAERPDVAVRAAVARTDPADPIAIVSMACRLPGDVRTPEDLWSLLVDGRHASGPLPSDRGWRADLYDPDATGRGHTSTDRGGFLYDAGDFDAEFFAISPREALAMDPQQRVLLESAWELVERAGIDPAALHGEQVGVYVGTNGQDYAGHLAEVPVDLEGHLLTGKSASVVSGRVAYAMGLQGPAVTVDTACSSSLTAIHLAADALRNGECALALAGGVTVMSTPGLFVEFTRQRGLAADGRVKAFGDGADGTSWSEGVALVLLEKLSDAHAHGHEVLGVIRGSALNQDGASNGLAAPNGVSQQRVIRDALAASGLNPADVDAVEAHGTGTRLGDPIEAQALLAAYGRDRDRPLWLGALKSNLGHTQAAAGAAGVIKLLLALRGEQLPRTLHADVPSRLVDWGTGDVRLLSEPVAWPAGNRPRRAAVSAFGISGTNAHLVLEEPPPAPEPPAVDRALPLRVWPLAARTPAALRAQAGRLAEHVRQAAPDPDEVSRALAATRTSFEHRAVALGADTGELVEALTALAEGRTSAPGLTVGERTEGLTGYVFTGQGAQRPGMGDALASAFPAFGAALDEVCAAADPHLSRPLRAAMADADALARTEFAQPAIFAFEVAVFRLLESWGLVPDRLLGHSIGEIAAAHVAGVLTLPDAAALVAHRARLMQALPDGGAMVAARITPEEAGALLVGADPSVGVAAINGPSAIVLSGAHRALAPLTATLAERGVRTRPLAVSHAFHSTLMEPMLDDFRAVTAGLRPAAPAIDGVSTLTGGPNTEWADPEYWVRHVVGAVRFADGVRALRAAGVTRFLEVGPDAALVPAIGECLAEDAEGPVVVAAAARRDRNEPVTLLAAVSALHTAGHSPDREAFWAAGTGPYVPLPTYPFQRSRYWYTPPREEPETAADPIDSLWDELAGLTEAEVGVGLDVPLGEALPALAGWAARRRSEATAESWMYEVTWPEQTPGPAAPGRRWAVLTPEDDDLGLADRLTARGHTVTTVPLPADAAADPRELVAALVAAGPLDAVLSVATTRTGRAPDAPASDGLAHAFALAAVAGALPGAPRIHLVTRGGAAVRDTEAVDPFQTAVWGVGRVLCLEHPESFGTVVDLGDAGAGAVDRLIDVVTAAGPDEQWAVRPEGTFVPRLGRRATRPGADRPVPTGTALVTGGTGGLGAHVARWLADAGCTHLVLVSRRGPASTGAADLERELRARGASVRIAACDVADPAALATLVEDVERYWPPIATVVHAAGVVDYHPLGDVTPDRAAAGLRAKTLGALALDRCFADRSLDAFVCFASIAGVWGSAEQGVYAAANAFLDGLVQQRRAAGRTGLSVAWGPWAEDGMIAVDGVEEALARHGLRPMPPAGALAALRRALADDDGCVVVVDLDWVRFAQTLEIAREHPMLRSVAGTPEAVEVAAESSAVDALAALPPAERRTALLDLLRQQTVEVLGHGDVHAIGTRRAFKDLGFDSMLAVELRNRMQDTFGLRLSAMLVFDHPDLEALAAELYGRLFTDDVADLTGVLDELEQRLSALPAAEPSRDAARERLQHLLHDLGGRPAARASRSAVDVLDGASADEVVRFIDGLVD